MGAPTTRQASRIERARSFGARDGRQSAERLVREAGGDVERFKALPENSWQAMLRRARFYAHAGWSREQVKTWSHAFHAASGEVIIPFLDAQIAAVDAEAKEALARIVEAYGARKIE